MAERKRLPLNITLHSESRQRLTELANRRQLNLSQVLEQLIDEAWDTEDHFMLKHAAMHSFVGAALAIATANKVLGKEDTAAVRREAASVARRLFGTAPTKRFDIREGYEADARVEALFNAFERDV
ncbi:hypothetical protein ASD89_01070 [Caulobacter sp. Root656]|nr:hypothetical protein ASD89_01070 [Caulobacter sp. Root656]